jgi:hypothetical protein
MSPRPPKSERVYAHHTDMDKSRFDRSGGMIRPVSAQGIGEPR